MTEQLEIPVTAKSYIFQCIARKIQKHWGRSEFSIEEIFDIYEINKYLLYVSQFEARESSDQFYCYIEIETDNIPPFVMDCLELSPGGYFYARTGFMDEDDSVCGLEILWRVTHKELYYKKYIQSEIWRSFRNRIFKKRGFKCELCDSKKNLQLHHITYERIGKEDENDVIILCQECHKKAHENN